MYEVLSEGSVGAEPAFMTTITPSPLPDPLQLMVMPVAPTLLKERPVACVDGSAHAALVANLKKPSVLMLFELLTDGELSVPPIEE